LLRGHMQYSFIARTRCCHFEGMLWQIESEHFLNTVPTGMVLLNLFYFSEIFILIWFGQLGLFIIKLIVFARIFLVYLLL
jgi:hypothetical protein